MSSTGSASELLETSSRTLSLAARVFAVAASVFLFGCGKAERPGPTESKQATTAAAEPDEVLTACRVAPRLFRENAPARLDAIGDLHGDLSATKDALRAADAIDESDKWIGGELVVVQTGDILDRGDDEVEIYDFLEVLSAAAERAGGAIILLNGNHEFMNAEGDMSYVTAGGFADFANTTGSPSGQQDRVAAFKPGGKFASRLAKFDVVAIVGDSVFAHGGIEPGYARTKLDRLNEEARCWFAGRTKTPPSFLTDDGPVWSRRFSNDPADCAALEVALEALGVERMVVGHTPQSSGITSACNKRVWRIDVGLSKHYGGPIEVLEVRGDLVKVLKGSRTTASQ